jgi:hypothetical protein
MLSSAQSNAPIVVGHPASRLFMVLSFILIASVEQGSEQNPTEAV